MRGTLGLIIASALSLVGGRVGDILVQDVAPGLGPLTWRWTSIRSSVTYPSRPIRSPGTRQRRRRRRARRGGRHV